MATYEQATYKTKRQLAEALLNILEKKPLQSISIRELTEYCGINRQTFYYHFPDIFGLLSWAIEDEKERFLSAREQWENWQQVMLDFFIYLKENSHRALCFYNSLERKSLRNFLQPEINKIISKMVENRAEALNIRPDRLRFIAHFYSVAFASVAENWLIDGMKETPQTMIDYLTFVYEGGVDGALKLAGS